MDKYIFLTLRYVPDILLWI